MTEEKILSRIRKMLTLANDEAASEGERDNAMRMAHNLLVKYQLDMSDVDAHVREKEDPRGHFTDFGYCAVWARRLRNHVAGLFMVKYYYQSINAMKDRNNFIGRESNATTAMLISEFLIGSILRESRLRYPRAAAHQRSFCVGAEYKLFDRIAAMLRAKQQEIKEAGYGLVLVEQAKVEATANEEFVKSMGTQITTTKARSEAEINHGAFRAGHEFGGTLSLNAQVGATTKATKRLT